jgi:hypothetical protein
MTREQLLQMHNSARIYQQRYDDAFSAWGARAKAPVLGENIDSYRRDLAVQGKRLLPEDHQLRAVQYRALNDNAFAALEPQLLKAVSEAARRNDSVPDGTMREIVEQTPTGKVIRFLAPVASCTILNPSPDAWLGLTRL